uniref:Uncharacterized protein n=1 Tax=Mycena chlorophos TaxID=658473 RepID=A0ABQ0KVV0_MYCCL|nr:predicted protein [Mycena chlorophos]
MQATATRSRPSQRRVGQPPLAARNPQQRTHSSSPTAIPDADYVLHNSASTTRVPVDKWPSPTTSNS